MCGRRTSPVYIHKDGKSQHAYKGQGGAGPESRRHVPKLQAVFSLGDAHKHEASRVNGLCSFPVDPALPPLLIRDAEEDHLLLGIVDPAGHSFTVPVKIRDGIVGIRLYQFFDQALSFLFPIMVLRRDLLRNPGHESLHILFNDRCIQHCDAPLLKRQGQKVLLEHISVDHIANGAGRLLCDVPFRVAHLNFL